MKRRPAGRTTEQRFWNQVHKTSTCWLWAGLCCPKGYGRFGRGKTTLAHRIAYEYLIGPIPDELPLDHLCRVRNCVRPLHLEPVSARENTRRSDNFVAEYMRRDRCKNGHLYTPENTAQRKRGKFFARVCRRCQHLRTQKWRKAKQIVSLEEAA